MRRFQLNLNILFEYSRQTPFTKLLPCVKERSNTDKFNVNDNDK